jgi:hypothetical protein
MKIAICMIAHICITQREKWLFTVLVGFLCGLCRVDVLGVEQPSVNGLRWWLSACPNPADPSNELGNNASCLCLPTAGEWSGIHKP